MDQGAKPAATYTPYSFAQNAVLEDFTPGLRDTYPTDHIASGWRWSLTMDHLRLCLPRTTYILNTPSSATEVSDRNALVVRQTIPPSLENSPFAHLVISKETPSFARVSRESVILQVKSKDSRRDELALPVQGSAQYSFCWKRHVKARGGSRSAMLDMLTLALQSFEHCTVLKHKESGNSEVSDVIQGL